MELLAREKVGDVGLKITLSKPISLSPATRLDSNVDVLTLANTTREINHIVAGDNVTITGDNRNAVINAESGGGGDSLNYQIINSTTLSSDQNYPTKLIVSGTPKAGELLITKKRIMISAELRPELCRYHASQGFNQNQTSPFSVSIGDAAGSVTPNGYHFVMQAATEWQATPFYIGQAARPNNFSSLKVSRNLSAINLQMIDGGLLFLGSRARSIALVGWPYQPSWVVLEDGIESLTVKFRTWSNSTFFKLRGDATGVARELGNANNPSVTLNKNQRLEILILNSTDRIDNKFTYDCMIKII